MNTATTNHELEATAEARPLIQVQTHLSWGDCDDCGGFSYGSAHIDLPGGRALSADHDGHLGNGCWDGDDDTLWHWCLQALGVRVTANGEPVHDRLYMERCDSGYDWEVVNLLEQELEHVELRVTSTLDADGYECPVDISWTRKDGTTCRLSCEVPAGSALSWDGDPKSVLRLLLEERAYLVVDESTQDDFSDDHPLDDDRY